MTPHDFIRKWKAAELSERSACQQHFLDLCELLGQPKPAEVDPHGLWYTFEKGVQTIDGGKGWADAWMQGKFGWEYKGKHKDLKAAYQQLLKYRESLENPPLLVVCDLDRFEIHTNFTGTVKKVHAFDLDGLADPRNILLLRHVFTNPETLRPGQTRHAITEEIAGRFARLTDALGRRGIAPEPAAHFLMQLMFCMFAQGIDLLPHELFTRTIAGAKKNPIVLSKLLSGLFRSMQSGEPFGADAILRFNGGLFADIHIIDLRADEIDEVHDAARCDWSSVEPTIFGTLFERSLDPSKRSQIGAHYTSRADIETVLKPVLLTPLQREWEQVKQQAAKAWVKVQAEARKGRTRRTDSKARRQFDLILEQFRDRLAHVNVLDPACGSGNFLYVAIHLLLDLEKEVLNFASAHDVDLIPLVRTTQLFGLEINPYAQQLAQVVVWIGYLQWKYFNGYQAPLDPVLDPFENIRHTDAVLDISDPDNPKEPEWPAAEFIVGNPPFLGTKKLRSELGDDYVEKLFKLYGERIPNFSDLCCYWFEKARAAVERGQTKRVGLIATQGIRGSLNRRVLERIKETGDIFLAWSDRDWILDGANVHISIIGFDDGTEKDRLLDGIHVSNINANLTATADITQAKRLMANRAVGYIADVKAGKFDISSEEALLLLHEPNPHGKPNSDVLRPWANGLDVTRRPREMWIIDFGADMLLDQASLYERPFEIVQARVKPARDQVKRKRYREYWWLHAEPCAEMRRRIEPLNRYLVTTTVSKHRLFVWSFPPTLPDHQLVAFARDEDSAFGILHSRIHEAWARAHGTQVRERESGFRYTPTTCFETFPFPQPSDSQREAIAVAAQELNERRSTWLNPPEWTREDTLIFPGSVDGPWGRYFTDADERGIGTVHYRRRVAKDGQSAKELAKRTLTNLYNQMPAWLKQAHQKLDEAVFATYGWAPTLSDEEILARLLELNLRSASASVS